VVAGTKNVSQKAMAPNPPHDNMSVSSNMHRPQVESNDAKLCPVSSPDSPSSPDRQQPNPSVSPADIASADFRPPEGLGTTMVEHVRRKTGLSHGKSQLAVATVLNLLAERIPATESLVTAVLEDVQHHHVCLLFVLPPT